MGLDISVYQNIKEVNESDDYDFYVFSENENDLHVKNLKFNGFYVGDKVSEFSGYAYSSHNRFREKLVVLISRSDLLLHDGTINWDKMSKESISMPFWELVYFSDCEGTMDFEVSKKLLNDFKSYAKKASKLLDEYHFRRYKEWMRVFELASNNGVVIFR